jgi:hypothetical protein
MITADRQQVFSMLPDGDVVILSLRSGVYYGLNSVAARVWNLIQKPSTVMEIVDTLVREYEIDPEQCKAEVEQLLKDLEENGLIMFEVVGQPT